MAGTILTPVAIWRDFLIEGAPNARVIEQKKSGGITFTDLKIDGRPTKDGRVSIYARFVKKGQDDCPAILFLSDFGKSDDAVVEDLAKKGYAVLNVDIAGKAQNKMLFTEYPESISYANYENVKDELYSIKEDAKNSCWYEWTAVAKYAIAYLRETEKIIKVGGLGIGEVATVMWQVAGTDNSLDAVCFALNAGWNTYRGRFKFAGEVEPQFSDDIYKYIAGIDSQTYAMHVEKPILMLSATNSNVYDLDRVYDTVSRASESKFKAVHYSVRHIDSINLVGYENALIFFKGFLMGKCVEELCDEIEIKCVIEDKKVIFEANPGNKDKVKNISLYVSEQIVDPALRSWQKITDFKKNNDEGYVFEYLPYHASGLVTAFVEVCYESGFTICSSVVSKKFAPEEIKTGYKSNIIYSSRYKNAENLFLPLRDFDEQGRIYLTDKKFVKVRKGGYGIEGMGCKRGLLTFKINADKDKPNEDGILMFDAHSKTDVALNVKLIVDYFGVRTEYTSTVKVFGGDVWHNFKLARTKFKTAEGMNLKSYDKVCAIAFDSDDGEFLINNALWV